MDEWTLFFLFMVAASTRGWACSNVCVEHEVEECRKDGAWVVTGEVEPRAIFTTTTRVGVR